MDCSDEAQTVMVLAGRPPASKETRGALTSPRQTLLQLKGADKVNFWDP